MKMEKSEKRDLTKFWLSWRATCDIRKCMDAEAVRRACADIPEAMADVDGVVADAHYVMRTSNWDMARLVRSPRAVERLKKFDSAGEDQAASRNEDERENVGRGSGGRVDNLGHLTQDGVSSFSAIAENDDDVQHQVQHRQVESLANSGAKVVSEYIDYAPVWMSDDFLSVPSAFELAQTHFYLKPPMNSGLKGETDGRKFKSWLFEEIGSRPGGLSQNLWGWLLKKEMTYVRGLPRPSRLLQVVKDSLGRATPVVMEAPDDTAENIFDRIRKTSDGVAEGAGAAKSFLGYLTEPVGRSGLPRWVAEYDVNDRLGICCKFFNLPISDVFVLELSRKSESPGEKMGHSGLSKRMWKRVGEVLTHVEEKHGFEAIRAIVKGGQVREALLEVVRTCGGVDGKSVDLDCVELLEHFGISVH